VKLTIDVAGFSRDIQAACASELSRVETAVAEEVKAGAQGLQSDLRRETEALLGDKIAKAWRTKFYPNKGDRGGPAGFVWSKAPKVIDFFSTSKIITPIGEAFAVPTDNVPRAGRGRRMTPIEVEARFNAELFPVHLPSGRVGLAIDVVAGRNGRGHREATARRKAQGRKAKPVLMFVLLRSIRSRKLIDLEAFANRWGARTAANIETRLERGI
jgi:hypothetical protein